MVQNFGRELDGKLARRMVEERQARSSAETEANARLASQAAVDGHIRDLAKEVAATLRHRGVEGDRILYEEKKRTVQQYIGFSLLRGREYREEVESYLVFGEKVWTITHGVERKDEWRDTGWGYDNDHAIDHIEREVGSGLTTDGDLVTFHVGYQKKSLLERSLSADDLAPLWEIDLSVEEPERQPASHRWRSNFLRMAERLVSSP